MTEKEVVIYSKNGCAPCRLLKNALSEEGVSFIEKNVSESESHLNELKELGFQSVPITLIDNEVVSTGFEPWKIKEVLGI